MNPERALANTIQHFNAGRYAQAETASRILLQNHPHAGILWKILAEARLRQAKTSIDEFAQAHRLLPEDPEILCSYGTALRDAKQLDAALAAYRLAIRLRPNYIAAYSNLGTVYERLKRYDDAEGAYLDALRLAPSNAAIHTNLGLLYFSRSKYAQAQEHYTKALAIAADDATATVGLANTLFSIGDAQGAASIYRLTIDRNPAYADAAMNYGMALLAQGHFNEGWAYYEARLSPNRTAPGLPMPTDMPCPIWTGESIDGKSILLHHEQGFGDNIQFIRFAQLLKDAGAANIEIFVHEALRVFFASNPYINSIITDRRDAKPADYWCPIGSLPLLCGCKSESAIPASVPYLAPAQSRIEKWRPQLTAPQYKVGIVWRGNPGHVNDTNRSLPSLGVLAPIWRVPRAKFYSLQKWAGENEASSPPPDQPIIDLGRRIEDFADTAAIVSQLDLIITVDTAVAHVAGALGKPCWIMLPAFCADWRWLLNRDDSPWYPMTTLYRQSTVDDWAPTVARIAHRLAIAAAK